MNKNITTHTGQEDRKSKRICLKITQIEPVQSLRKSIRIHHSTHTFQPLYHRMEWKSKLRCWTRRIKPLSLFIKFSSPPRHRAAYIAALTEEEEEAEVQAMAKLMTMVERRGVKDTRSKFFHLTEHHHRSGYC